jgi:hypothetical protein
MNPMDMPLGVVLAVWLYRRLTRPPVQNVTVDLLQHLLNNITAVFRMLENRLEYRNKNWMTRLLYWYITRQITTWRDRWAKASEMGIKTVIAVKKEK